MDVDVMLCDHAQVSGSKLFISGANIDRVISPAGSPPPFQVSLVLAGLIHVPWDATNAPHSCHVSLRDEDGRPTLLPGDTPSPIDFDFGFTVGRPAGLAAGATQNHPFICNLDNVPLPARGRYVFEISIDGVHERSVSFSLD